MLVVGGLSVVGMVLRRTGMMVVMIDPGILLMMMGKLIQKRCELVARGALRSDLFRVALFFCL